MLMLMLKIDKFRSRVPLNNQVLRSRALTWDNSSRDWPGLRYCKALRCVYPSFRRIYVYKYQLPGLSWYTKTSYSVFPFFFRGWMTVICKRGHPHARPI